MSSGTGRTTTAGSREISTDARIDTILNGRLGFRSKPCYWVFVILSNTDYLIYRRSTDVC